MADIEITSSFEDNVTPALGNVTNAVNDLGAALGKLSQSEEVQRTLLAQSQSLGQIPVVAEQAKTGIEGLFESFTKMAEGAAQSFSPQFEKILHAGLEPIAAIAPTAAHAIESFVESLGPMGELLATVGAGLIAGADGLFKFAEKAAAAGVELEHLQLRTGAQVDSLQAFGLAAEKAGLGASSVGMAFRFMERSIDGAVAGTGRAGEAFQRLGLSVEDLLKLKPEDQLTLLASKLDAVADPASKGALAMQIFGRQGQLMIPMFHELAQGMDELKSKLAFTFTPEMTDHAREFHSAMVDLENTTKSFGTALGIRLAPAFSEVIEALDTSFKAILRWEEANHIFESIGTAAGVMGDLISKTFGVIGTAVENVTDLFHAFGTTFGDAINEVVQNIPVIGQVIPLLQMLNQGATYEPAKVIGAPTEELAKGLSAEQFSRMTGASGGGEQSQRRFEATQKEYDAITKGAAEAALARVTAEDKLSGDLEKIWEDEKNQAILKIEQQAKEQEQKLDDMHKKAQLTEQQFGQASVALAQETADRKATVDADYVEKKRKIEGQILQDEQQLNQRRLENELALQQSRLKLTEEIQKTGQAHTTTVSQALSQSGALVSGAETQAEGEKQKVQDDISNNQASLQNFIATENLKVTKAQDTAALMAAIHGADSREAKKAAEEAVIAESLAQDLIKNKREETNQKQMQDSERLAQVEMSNAKKIADAKISAIEEEIKHLDTLKSIRDQQASDEVSMISSHAAMITTVNEAEAQSAAARLRFLGDQNEAERTLIQAKIDNAQTELTASNEIFAAKARALQMDQEDLQVLVQKKEAELAAAQAAAAAAVASGGDPTAVNKQVSALQDEILLKKQAIAHVDAQLVDLGNQHVASAAKFTSQIDQAQTSMQQLVEKASKIPDFMAQATKETQSMVSAFDAVNSAIQGAASGLIATQNRLGSIMMQIENLAFQGPNSQQQHELGILGLEQQKANLEGNKAQAQAIQENINAIQLESVNRQLAANMTDAEAQQSMQRAQQRVALEDQLNAATQQLNSQFGALAGKITAINQAATNASNATPLFQHGLEEGPSPGGIVHTEPGEVIATPDQARGILSALQRPQTIVAGGGGTEAGPMIFNNTVNANVTVPGMVVADSGKQLNDMASAIAANVSDRQRRGV